MTLLIISEDSENGFSVNSNDTITLLSGVALSRGFGEGAFIGATGAVSDATVNILGTALSEGAAVDFSSSTASLGNVDINVGSEAFVYGLDEGVSLEFGTDISVSNEGTIRGGADAIDAQGGSGNHSFFNSGLIDGGAAGISISGSSVVGSLNTITNTGTISGFGDSAASSAIRVNGRTETAILNSGIIIGEQGIAISVSNSVNAASVALNLTNSGEIFGTVNAADDIVASIGNSGTIDGVITLGELDDVYRSTQSGFAAGINAGGGDDYILGGGSTDTVNGEDGDDTLFGGDDTDFLDGGAGEDQIYGGAGFDVITGGDGEDTILGGSGNDFIDGDDEDDDIDGNSGDDEINGGNGEDNINGGSGEDNVRGGVNADLIYGNSGDDLLRGESGGDSIFGGSGNDTISGSTGHDQIDGGSGNDRIFGGANNDVIGGTLGDDFIDGGSGRDIIFGGSDDDTILGGADQDFLSGGNGSDRFIFNSVSDSEHGSQRDTISDFTVGEDIIDLSGFAETLTFVGGFSYSGTAGEVRYVEAIGRLYIDIDGDRASDFSVDLAGDPALTGLDLIL